MTVTHSQPPNPLTHAAQTMPAPPCPTDRVEDQAGEVPDSEAGDGLRERVVHGGLVTVANQAGKFSLRMIGTMVLARLLRPEDFGIVAMVGSLVGFAGMLRDFGLTTAVVQRPVLRFHELNAVFWVNLLLSLTLSLALVAAGPLVASFYAHPSARYITWSFAAIGLAGCLGNLHYAVLQRQMRFGAIAARDLMAAAAGLAAGIWAAAAGLGFWALVIMEAVGTLAGTAFLWWRSGWRPGLPRYAAGVGELLHFGGAMTLSNILGYANHNLDNILLGRFLGDAAVGFYSRAQVLLNRPLEQVLPPIMSVAMPMLSRVAADPPRFQRASLHLVRIASFGGCLLSMVLISGADWIVPLMLGPSWMEVIPIFRVLCVFGLLEPLAWVLGLILVAHGQPGAMARWRAVTFAAVAAAFLAGIPFGVIGVAAGYTVSGIVTRVWLIFFVSRRVGLPAREVFRACAPFVLMAGTVAAGLWTLRDLWGALPPVWSAAAVTSTAAILYVLGLSLFPQGRHLLTEALRLGPELAGRIGRGWTVASTRTRRNATQPEHRDAA